MWRSKLGKMLLATVVLALFEVEPAAAQHQIGAGFGYLLDREANFIALTSDARIKMPSWKLALNPRINYFMGTGTNLQFDANLLYDVTPIGRFRPYLGGGAAINYTYIESAVIGVEDFSVAKVGANLIYGGTVGLNRSPLQLFGHLQYSAIPDFADLMVFYTGALLRVGGSPPRAARR